MRAAWVDHFLNNEIYCYPLYKKAVRTHVATSSDRLAGGDRNLRPTATWCPEHILPWQWWSNCLLREPREATSYLLTIFDTNQPRVIWPFIWLVVMTKCGNIVAFSIIYRHCYDPSTLNPIERKFSYVLIIILCMVIQLMLMTWWHDDPRCKQIWQYFDMCALSNTCP